MPGPADDKYSRGVLGVVAGGEGYTGAAVLCVTAAVAAGAGMVRYVGPPTPTALVRAVPCPEAVHGDGRVQAWVVGPGLDPAERPEHGRAQRRAALDALASGCAVRRRRRWARPARAGPRPAPTLLTPHAGELARLLTRLDRAGRARRRRAAAPVRHARRLADLTGATVLLKGATTLVVAPERAGRCAPRRTHRRGWPPPAPATCWPAWPARCSPSGLSPLDAGALAALVHGLAGDAGQPRRAGAGAGVWRTPYRRSWRGSWRAGRTDPERLAADERQA